MFCRPREVKSEWSFILPRKISFQLVSKLVDWSPGGPLCHLGPFSMVWLPIHRSGTPHQGRHGHSIIGGSGAPEGHRTTGGSGTSGAQKNRTWVPWAQWNRRVKDISRAEQQEMSWLHNEKGLKSLKKRGSGAQIKRRVREAWGTEKQ